MLVYFYVSQYLVLLVYFDECGISAKGVLAVYVSVATKIALGVQFKEHVYAF